MSNYPDNFRGTPADNELTTDQLDRQFVAAFDELDKYSGKVWLHDSNGSKTSVPADIWYDGHGRWCHQILGYPETRKTGFKSSYDALADLDPFCPDL